MTKNNQLYFERRVQLIKAGFIIEKSENRGIENIIPSTIPENYPHLDSKPASIGYLFYRDGSYFIPLSRDPIIRPYQIQLSTITPLNPADIVIR